MQVNTNICPKCGEEMKATSVRSYVEYFNVCKNGRIRMKSYELDSYENDHDLNLSCRMCDFSIEASFDPTGNFAEVDDVAWKEALEHAQRAG